MSYYGKIETPINKLEIHEITKEVYQYLRDNDLLNKEEVVYIRDLEEQMQDAITSDIPLHFGINENGGLRITYDDGSDV